MFPFETIITIDRSLKLPVYRQIAVSIIQAVRNGVIKPGTPLLSSREMARLLGVHRKTVIAAYDELNAQDWITILPRKQVHVSEKIPHLRPQKWEQEETTPPYQNSLNIPFVEVEPITTVQPTDSFRWLIDDGRPDIRLSPISSLLKTYRLLAARKSVSKKTAQDNAQGTIRLRIELANYLSETRGINISEENLLITHGAQMSIYLAARLLAVPKTSVIVGKPNYPMANKVFNQLNATLIEVAMDSNGLDVDKVEQLCKKTKISVVYVIPHHHYPTTVTLSVERRIKLLELSKRYNFVIIEDDYDYDYHYSSSPYLPLASAQHHGNIIYIGSFSKVLDPAIRIGFMVAPVNFIAQATELRKIIDIGGDMYMQDALAVLIQEREISRHLKKAKKVYHQRRERLAQLLQQSLSSHVSYSIPSGGMAMWIRFNSIIDIQELTDTLVKNRLKISCINKAENAFRFGFASMEEQELEETVDLIKQAVEKLILKN
ncbi:PLP-dependent aminotransferase family protein [uncultured Sunxiuqinia sp.]|uniref:MocR-like pyridoxine biosynthesis transcription factor PdxR n=1 Tax=uncultured Sunxiuqinia sp. TaxID=1573825 RepID=UPI00262C883B|nr:PLP-dependent aminotransferase family protein [uncultured Sunxiuqinia sp.]